ncbi:acetyltransferase [Heyndrickxia sporothermodurans]|uniref:acetyltransferase n=1 Tax=Heyndrickxia sporothermodurans TaxID=46224 RepID=UPI002E235C09|nr:acetyltransferase [Heyndrickxia sporothermodurans]MED3696917.1 acetyltransferase [Heyndrickxia sporothermodurans]
MKELYIVGSGGFSKQVIEIVKRINEGSKIYELKGLIDDDKTLHGQEVMGFKVVGNTDYLKSYSENNKVYGVIAIASGDVRRKISQKLDSVQWVNIIHPNTVISDYVEMGRGNIICAGVIINPECSFGDHCHINIGTTIGHDVLMLNYVTVMPGSRISGNVTLKSNSMVGTGSSIIQGITIEENVRLGAGAVVTKNTAPDSLYVGIPAKQIKEI